MRLYSNEQNDLMSIRVEGAVTLLQVYDMPASLSFYRDKLGFNVKGMAPNQTDDCDWALLELSGVELMLNTAYERSDRPDSPDPQRLKHHQDTTIYFGCPDVIVAYQQIRANRIECGEPYKTQYGYMALEIFDPDGYRLCFHWPLRE